MDGSTRGEKQPTGKTLTGVGSISVRGGHEAIVGDCQEWRWLQSFETLLNSATI